MYTAGVPAGGDFDVYPRVRHARASGLKSVRVCDVHEANGQHVQFQGGAGVA